MPNWLDPFTPPPIDSPRYFVLSADVVLKLVSGCEVLGFYDHDFDDWYAYNGKNNFPVKLKEGMVRGWHSEEKCERGRKYETHHH